VGRGGEGEGRGELAARLITRSVVCFRNVLCMDVHVT